MRACNRSRGPGGYQPRSTCLQRQGTLYAFPTGIFLRFGPAGDGKWHRRKWTATDFRDNGAAREVAGSGRRGALRATVTFKDGRYEAQTEGDSVRFRNGAALY
jgi:hypothetical protein